jgi:hypothetical protein
VALGETVSPMYQQEQRNVFGIPVNLYALIESGSDVTVSFCL